VELPEESLAHYHRTASRNHVPIRLALPNVPERYLLPNLRKQSFPNIGPNSQRGLRYLVRINRHLPLPRNEANQDLPRTGSPSEEKGPTAEDVKTTPIPPDISAQDR
jgi:hypothetical protein